MTEQTYRAELFATRSVVFYSVLALSTLPLWLTTYLPMVDLPQHAAQITALREYLDGLGHQQFAIVDWQQCPAEQAPGPTWENP